MKIQRVVLGLIVVALLLTFLWKGAKWSVAQSQIPTNSNAQTEPRVSRLEPAADFKVRPAQSEPQSDSLPQVRVVGAEPSSVNVVARRIDSPLNRPNDVNLTLNASGSATLSAGTYLFYVQDRETGLIEKIQDDGRGFAIEEGKLSTLDLSNVNFTEAFVASMNRLQRRMEERPELVKSHKQLPDEILVRFHPATSLASIREINDRFGARVRKLLPRSKVYRVEISANDSVQSAIQRYAGDSSVEYAEPNHLATLNVIPNDGTSGYGFDRQWGLHNTPTVFSPGDVDIDAPEAWDIETGNSSVVVAVIDSGVATSHSDLAGNLWSNAGETAGDGIDNDGNGYRDDVHGWFFNGFGFNSSDVNPEPPSDSDTINDRNRKGHGTHVAGIIGAIGNNGSDGNGRGIAGVIWDVQLMVIKMEFGRFGTGVGEFAEAIRYAADEGADVINMSLSYGTAQNTTISQAIQYAFENGSAMCVSTGNDDAGVSFPGRHEKVIGVGAISSFKRRSWFSNYGTELDIVAPGEFIYSTWPHTLKDEDGNYSGFNFLSGTSQAAPFASGVAALLISRFPTLRNNPDQIYEALKTSADDIIYSESGEVAGTGWDEYTGFGLLNARNALANRLTATITSLSPRVLNTMPVGQRQWITITGSGFTSSSTLSFNDGTTTYPSNPAHLDYRSTTEIRYNIAVGPDAATWTVKVLNGVVESLPYTFYVVNGGAQLTALAVSGPALIVENGSGQFTATAQFSDGSSQNVTGLTTWGENSVATTISASGLLSAGSVGSDTAVTVSASFTSGGITRTANANVTVVNSGSCGSTAQELISNGALTHPVTQWSLAFNFYADNRFTTARSAGGYAYLSNPDGTAGNNLYGELAQSVTIPANASQVTLSYWYRITTAETSGSADTMTLQVVPQVGAVETIDTRSNAHANGAYQQRSFDITRFKGQQILIGFAGITDSLRPTTFRVDDVSVVATIPNPVVPVLFGVGGPTSVAEGSTAQYNAIVVNCDGSIQSVSPSWSENSGATTISGSGLLTAGNVGSDTPVTITATYGGFAPLNYPITVVNSTSSFSYLAISGPSSINENSSGQFTASAIFSDGSSQSVSPSWSENSAATSISGSGLLMAGGVGSDTTVTVSASHTIGGVTRHATQEVLIINVPTPPTLTSLSISGPSSLNENSAAQYTATASFSDGSSQGINPTWSEDSSATSISIFGLLSAGEVASDTPMTVSASYTFGGVTRNDSKNVTVVNGVVLTYTLSISASNGSVAKIPDQATYASGSQVILTATPTNGFVFANWSGDASGSVNPLTVTMNANKSITANFIAAAQSSNHLTTVNHSNGVIRFVLNGPAGSNYVIQVSSNLVDWVNRFVKTIPVGGSIVVAEAAAGHSRRFYRAITNDGGAFVAQPGPLDGNDIWTTSFYSYAPGGNTPGGGMNNEQLRVGGWADQYYSLIQFDLTDLPTNVTSAVLHLFCYHQSGGGTTMHFEQVTSAWDWRNSGTGRDRERLWWADRPSATPWGANPVPNPTTGQWYTVDITGLYNAWQNGTYPNFGVQLRPVNFNANNFNEFYSADHVGDPTLRPKLVVTP